MRYYLYARRSSDESSGKQMQSLEGQIDACLKIATAEGLNVVEVLKESRTAKKPGRPLFNQMMAGLEAGEAEAILCYDLDRLSRNPKDSGDLRWLLQQGVIKEIRTPRNVYLPRDSCLITGIETAMSEQFIIQHTERVERGMRQKTRSGGFPHRAPEGYLNDRVTKTIEIDPVRFPLLRRAWELLLAGSHTVPEIHRKLHDEWGYRKRPTGRTSSDRYALSLLYKLFTNPFYAGITRSWGEEHIGNWAPMVTPDEFRRAQTILQSASRPHHVRHTFAYTGLIRCARCGCIITAEVSRGHTYYHCTNRRRRCSYRGVRAEWLDMAFLERFSRIAIGPAFLAWAEERLLRDEAEHARAEAAADAARSAASAAVQKQLDILLTLRLREAIAEDEFVARRAALKREATLLATESGAPKRAAQNEAAKVAEALRFAAHAPRQFGIATDSDKRFYVHQYASSVTLKDGALAVDVAPLLQPILAAHMDGHTAVLTLESLEKGSGSRQSPTRESVFDVWWSILHAIRIAARESTPPSS